MYITLLLTIIYDRMTKLEFTTLKSFKDSLVEFSRSALPFVVQRIDEVDEGSVFGDVDVVDRQLAFRQIRYRHARVVLLGDDDAVGRLALGEQPGALVRVPRVVAARPRQVRRERLEEVEERVRDDHVVVDADDGRYDHHAVANTLDEEGRTGRS